MDYKEKIQITWERFDQIYYKIEQEYDTKTANNSLTFIINTILYLGNIINNESKNLLDDEFCEKCIDEIILSGSRILGEELCINVVNAISEFIYNTYDFSNKNTIKMEFNALIISIKNAIESKQITTDYLE